jgi:hypothetical protein
MLFFGFGALLVIVGLVELAGPPIWRGRLSGKRSRAATIADNTLEPKEPGAGFALAANWPSPALIALGAVLLLVGAAF